MIKRFLTVVVAMTVLCANLIVMIPFFASAQEELLI